MKPWIVVLVAALAAAGGALVYLTGFQSSEKAASVEAGVRRLYVSRFADPAGVQQAVDQWRQKVLVVNFWATWCAPCREEIPIFIDLQSKYRDRGVIFLGIAIDQADKVASYAKDMGMNYPVLIGGIDSMDLARQLGNAKSVLPFTVVVDRSGSVILTEAGALKADRLERTLKPHI